MYCEIKKLKMKEQEDDNDRGWWGNINLDGLGSCLARRIVKKKQTKEDRKLGA